jgi:hypothetical protein
VSRNVTVLLLVLGAVCTAGGQVLAAYNQTGAAGAVSGLGFALAAIARMQVGGEAPKS